MPVVEDHTYIARAPEEVFHYLSRPENLPLWDSSIVQVEQVDPGPLARGTRWRGVSKIMGRRFDWTTEVTDVHPPSRMDSRSIEGKLTFAVVYSLKPEGDGTRLTYRVEAASGLGGVFGRFADPLVQSAQSRSVRANLERLAGLLGSSAVVDS
ncbi:MAG TPA: SRPBCC family protein [Actinomycetales bacterium]|nr:SRPBCC family protein [Actinomycetales bacterium]